MTNDENTSGESDDFPLIAQLVQANLLQSQASSSAIIESLTERAEIAEAALAAIRDRVISLFNQEHLPNPKLVIEGLFPPQAIINEYRELKEQENTEGSEQQ